MAEDELLQTVKAHNAPSGDVVVIDPHNGDILALASYPTYDIAAPNKAPSAAITDHAVSDLYEPGSTMKTLTMSAVLAAQGLQKANEHIHCSGQMNVGGHTIHCAKDPPYNGVHGDEDMRAVLKIHAISERRLLLSSWELISYTPISRRSACLKNPTAAFHTRIFAE